VFFFTKVDLVALSKELPGKCKIASLNNKLLWFSFIDNSIVVNLEADFCHILNAVIGYSR
jgi:hypothetical protein